MKSTNMSTYVLKLENNKYYIGTSENILQDIIKHTSGKGPTQTRIHRPVEIEKIIEDLNEEEVIIEYMRKYGVHNVFFQPQVEVSDVCKICKRSNHTEETCKKKIMCDQCGRVGHFNFECKACWRCKREGHKAYQCTF